MQTDYDSPFLPALRFDERDVQANRQGLLTPEQTQRVEMIYTARQRGARQMFWGLALSIALLIVISGVMALAESGEAFAGIVPGLILTAGMMAVVVSGVSVFSAVSARDARDKRISTVEGVVKLAERPFNTRYTRSMRYEVRLRKGMFGRHRFRFANRDALRYFEAGETYRLYYIKYYPFPIVLSAERV